LSALKPMFEFPVTTMGYGYLDEVPAPYALKYLSLGTYLNLIAVGLGLPRRWPKRFVDGFERLWHRVAAKLDVRLCAEIAAVDRGGAKVRLRSRNAEAAEFDYLVLACPLAASSLASFLTLSAEERDLFSRIVVNTYVVATYALPDLQLPRRIVGMTPIPAMGRPWALTQQFADRPLVQFYTRLPRSAAVSQAQVIDAIRSFVAALGARRPEKYLTYSEWDYFPHVAAPDFRDGFYDRLEALQGQANTFYCGGVAAFELVETVVRYSRNLVETHF